MGEVLEQSLADRIQSKGSTLQLWGTSCAGTGRMVYFSENCISSFPAVVNIDFCCVCRVMITGISAYSSSTMSTPTSITSSESIAPIWSRERTMLSNLSFVSTV